MELYTDVGGSASDRIMERIAFLNMRRLAIRNSKQSVFGEDSQTVVDSSLTSLGWLQNLKVLDLFSPEVKVPLAPPSPSCSEGDWETVSSSDSLEEKAHIGISLSPIRKCLLQSAEFRRTPKKFRNKTDKPPYSYTTLIYLAVHNSKNDMVTLNEIYRWIKENFKYYRTAEAAWQNSIRHNLSLNELFVKVPRSQGRGNHWKVNPDYEHILSEGGESFLLDYPKLKGKGRKRAHSMSCRDGTKNTQNGRKRAKSVQTPADPCGLPGDLDWVSLLSSQKVSCAICPSPEACRPVFGSPVLGPPDLGHIGDPVVCSPLTVPSTTIAELPTTPAVGESKSALLEEAVLVQDSPSPNLLPWADSRMLSPAITQPHPWAESKEMTLNGIRFLCKDKVHPRKTMWSPDSSWSLSYSSSSSSNSSLAAKRTALISGASMY